MVSNISHKETKPFTLVFGLTADPIHKGHEQVILNSFAFAETQRLSIDELLLVPTYEPNLIAGKEQPQTSYKNRFAMCEIIAEKMRKSFNITVHVSDIEKQLYQVNQHKSYSYHTLKAIKKSKKLFVASADHFTGRWPKFRKWHQWKNLVKEHGLLIHKRPGHGINSNFVDYLRTINPDVFVIKNMPSIEVSSTQLRNTLRQNQTPDIGLLSQEVVLYIKHHQLYQA